MRVTINARVIVRPNAGYEGRYTNEIGTVLRDYKDTVGAKLDNFTSQGMS